MIDIDTYWPKSVAHLVQPYDDGVAEDVVIAEIDDSPYEGNKGFRKISTALVPLDYLDAVLNSRGGIGWEVKSWGPHPCVDEGRVFDAHFWVDGRKDKDERFQTILNAWKYHDQEVVLPDSVMLMTYGLVPRYLGDGTVCWDDPQKPVYDVVRALSHVDYNRKTTRPLVRVTMRRDYLEDYCSLKGCAAVAVYYEERFSAGDDSFIEVLGGEEGREFDLPGRLLGMAVLNDRYHESNPQFSRVWGVRLILRPAARPITDAKDPELIWPDDTAPMTYERAAREWVYGYVSDEVLAEYESRPEFSVQPELGGVSYGGWWGTSYTYRFGREHIKVELKKLYEGCPPHVISHWHRYAVNKSDAEHDHKNHGDRNVAVRAKELIYAYMRVTEALEELSDRLGAGFTQEDIGGVSTAAVDYSGWWTSPELKPLGFVVRLSATREQYLGRAVSIFKLLEGLKPAPLRNMALQLKVPKDKIKDFGSVKLLGTLCQMASVASEHGHTLPDDADVVAGLWDAKTRLPFLRRSFALNSLRVCHAHASSRENDQKIADASAVFGIDVGTTAGGWGYAIDALYDGLIADLNSIAEQLRPI